MGRKITYREALLKRGFSLAPVTNTTPPLPLTNLDHRSTVVRDLRRRATCESLGIPGHDREREHRELIANGLDPWDGYEHDWRDKLGDDLVLPGEPGAAENEAAIMEAREHNRFYDRLLNRLNA